MKKTLNEAVNYCREGDILVVWRLNILGKNVIKLLEFLENLEERGIGFKSMQEDIDTSSSMKETIFQTFRLYVELKRESIIERTNPGLAAARAQGKLGGRKSGISEENKIKAIAAVSLYHQQKQMSISQICKQLDISRSTLYKFLRLNNVEIGIYKKGNTA